MSKLAIDNLEKSYNGRRVVNCISLDMSHGEVVGLLGPNGAGKTTCFYMIVGLVYPDAGHIFLEDQDVTRMSIHKRAHLGLGYLPQESSVFKKLSVYDNLMAVLEMQKNFSRAACKEKVESLLEEFHLTHISHSMGMSLSGGERRRVEIARLLALHPTFVLLDEPFAGVDPISVQDIKNIILYLRKKNIGILITDHNVRETLDICDRAYIVHDGKMIAKGSDSEILENELVKSVYLGENFII